MTGRRAALGLLAAAAAVAGGVAGAHGSGAAPARPRLVEVRVPQGLTWARATGVVVGPGRVLTVAHVLNGAPTRTAAGRDLKARGRRGSDTFATPDAGSRGAARVLRVDEDADVALLAVPGVRGPRVALAPDAPGTATVVLPEGTRAAAAEPHRATFTALDGTVSRRPVLRLDTTVRPGDSGSPVLDDEGRLAGIVFAADDSHPGHAWATAAAGLRTVLDASAR